MRMIVLALTFPILLGCTGLNAENPTSKSPSGEVAAVKADPEPSKSSSQDGAKKDTACGTSESLREAKAIARDKINEGRLEAVGHYRSRSDLESYIERRKSEFQLDEISCRKKWVGEPNPLCLAALGEGTDGCMKLESGERKECETYRLLFTARAQKDPSVCEGIGWDGPAAFCRYVTGEPLVCPPDLKKDFRGGCEWLSTRGLAPCVEPGSACRTASFVQALKTSEAERCDTLQPRSFRGLCRAAILGDVLECEGDLEDEALCRKGLMMPPRLVEDGGEWKAELYFANLFQQPMACLGSVQVRSKGRLLKSFPVELREIAAGNPAQGVAVDLGELNGEVDLKYDGGCQWRFPEGYRSGNTADNGVRNGE